MIKIIGFGAGGHAKVVLEILMKQKSFELLGFLDPDSAKWGKLFCGVPVLGGDEEFHRLIESEGVTAFFLGVGAVKSLEIRRKVYEHALNAGLYAINVIHSTAYISESSMVGKGITAMVGSIINAGSRIGDNVIVNTGAIVEHDCFIGDHVHIATGARLSGSVRVGSETMIGAGSVVRQGISIGNRSVIGAGAVVVKDVPDGVVVAGNPARRLSELKL